MSAPETHQDTQVAQSNRNFHRFDRNEFERGLAKIAVALSIVFTPKEYSWSNERIYEAIIDDDFEGGELIIRIYSSIHCGEARDKGRDAIRTVGMYRPQDGEKAYPVAVPDTEHTQRIPTWQSNLRPDIEQVKGAIERRDFKRCECGNLQCRREKEGTPFWGCIDYPRCDHTTPVEGNPACPCCGEAMIERENSNDGSPFWGCISFPDCRGTRPSE